MKYISLVFSVIFVLFAALQVNDPDPYVWIPVYLLPAVICFMGFRNRYNVYVAGITALLFFIAAMYIMPESVSAWIQNEMSQQSMEMKRPLVEDGRESFGLLICVAALAFNIFSFYRSKKLRVI